jgi:hypothetical protein
VVTHRDNLVRVDVVLDRQLAGRDDAFGLVTDVEKNLVVVDLDDDAFDDVAIVEVLDREVDRCHEVFGCADVIDGDGGSSGSYVGSTRHGWCKPRGTD